MQSSHSVWRINKVDVTVLFWGNQASTWELAKMMPMRRTTWKVNHGETQLTLVLKPRPGRSAVSLLLPPPSCNTQCDLEPRIWGLGLPWSPPANREHSRIYCQSLDSISQRKIDTLRPYTQNPNRYLRTSISCLPAMLGHIQHKDAILHSVAYCLPDGKTRFTNLDAHRNQIKWNGLHFSVLKTHKILIFHFHRK